MPRLHATPYDITYAGFYFDTAEEFTRRMRTAPYEEVEIQFIDGTDEELEVFKSFGVHQGNLLDYLEILDELDLSGVQLAAVAFLVRSCGYAWDDAIDAHTDVDIYPMNLHDLARHFAEEGIFPASCPDSVFPYLNYDRLARELGMDYTEFSFLGQTYCARSP